MRESEYNANQYLSKALRDFVPTLKRPPSTTNRMVKYIFLFAAFALIGAMLGA